MRRYPDSHLCITPADPSTHRTHCCTISDPVGCPYPVSMSKRRGGSSGSCGLVKNGFRIALDGSLSGGGLLTDLLLSLASTDWPDSVHLRSSAGPSSGRYSIATRLLVAGRQLSLALTLFDRPAVCGRYLASRLRTPRPASRCVEKRSIEFEFRTRTNRRVVGTAANAPSQQPAGAQRSGWSR